jgi:ParB-like nuclease domain
MIEVHPLAAVFPMMTDDELADLADDIKQHGLLHPIVLDADGVLIDGRNRLRACEIAEVEPLFQRLNGHDPAAFIMSANVARRQMTKGAIAMVVAVAYPDQGSIIEPARMVHKGRLSTARAVIQHAPWLVEQVIGGQLSLEKAAVTAQEKRAEARSVEAQMAELRRVSPEIADMVVEERLTLAEAYAAHQKRMADAAAAEANKRENMLRLSEAAWHGITAWASVDFVFELLERLKDPEFSKQWMMRVRPDPTRIEDVVTGAEKLTLVIKAQCNV